MKAHPHCKLIAYSHQHRCYLWALEDTYKLYQPSREPVHYLKYKRAIEDFSRAILAQKL